MKKYIKSPAGLALFMALGMGLWSCSGPKNLSKLTDEESCLANEGYWYKAQCWADFSEHGYNEGNIDSVYKAEMEAIGEAYISINNETKPLEFFLPQIENDLVLIIAAFDDLENNLILNFESKSLEEHDFSADASLLKGNILEGPDNLEPTLIAEGSLAVKLEEEFEVDINGQLTAANGQRYDISLHGNESVMGAGKSQLEVKGQEAFLSGTLGTMTYGQIRQLISEHPEVTTIVLTQVSGSVNDDINLFTCRMVRNAGLNTKVLADSDIASGAVDFFASGKERILTRGAKLGVHSWGGGDFNGDEIPKDHPAHQYQLAYFTAMMGKEKGPDFYFYTLAAAPAADIYYMREDEILSWKLATTVLD